MLKIRARANGQERHILGRAVHIDGRTASVAVTGQVGSGSIHSVTTIGKEEPTTAEGRRALVMLDALGDPTALFTIPFVRHIWLPQEKVIWADTSKFPLVALHYPSNKKLNSSQNKAVKIILSNQDTHRVAKIQGPPGTGKTTVIAAAVTSVMASKDRTLTVWLVAQSNVAVKNIAEKLAQVGFWGFKILVSKDFHFDW